MFQGKTKAEKLKIGRMMFMNCYDRDRRWQGIAREDFAFRDGYQWTSAEKQILEEELRPVLTMNLTKSSIDLVMGLNEDTKQKFRATPAEPSDGFLAEVLNDVMDWVYENFEFEIEEDNAMESSAICGRGFVGVDFRPDPDRFGEIVMDEIHIPVHEVHYDPAARETGFKDAGYVFWDRWIHRHDFQLRWPQVSNKKIEELIHDSNPGDPFIAAKDSVEHAFDIPHDMDWQDDRDYDRELDYDWFDRNQNMIRVVHMEYWEMFKRYFVFQPETGKFEEIEHNPNKEEKAAFLEEYGEEMTVEVITDKKVKWLIFAGDRILFDGDSPLPYRGFSIVPVLAFSDVSRRTNNHFGIVRLMKDPQKEINKRWSQVLNMLNQQVQTGLFAEIDAFVDRNQAEQAIKEPGAIAWVQPGAIAGGKIQERGLPNFPNAPMQMEQFSQDILKKITGINPDLLGQDSGRREPGVVVRMRQQQGITLLKPLFRNFNICRKELFKRQMAIVLEYMPDAQILRILGQSGRYEISEEGIITDTEMGLEADLRDVLNLNYNIAAESSPNNLTKRMYELQTLLEMSQQLPVPPNQIIEKMDIPASEKSEWMEYIAQQEQAQSEQQQMAVEFEMKKEGDKNKLDEQKNMMDFLIAIGKLNQMSEKDEKKMKQDLLRLDLEEQKSIMESVTNMMGMMQTLGEDEENGKTKQPEQQKSSTS